MSWACDMDIRALRRALRSVHDIEDSNEDRRDRMVIAIHNCDQMVCEKREGEQDTHDIEASRRAHNHARSRLQTTGGYKLCPKKPVICKTRLSYSIPHHFWSLIVIKDHDTLALRQQQQYLICQQSGLQTFLLLEKDAKPWFALQP